MGIRELKVLIGRNQVRKVLKIVLQSECWKGDEALFDEWVRLSQRYHELKSLDKNAGWDPSELDRRRSIVVEALIKFLNKLPEDTQFTKAGSTWGWQAQTWTVGMNWEGLNYQYVENLKRQTSSLLKINPDDIRVSGVQEGSLIFQVVLPAAAAFDFRHKFKNGKHSTFFKQLRITSIKHHFPTPAGYLYFCAYWLSYGIHHRRLLVVAAALVVFAGIVFGMWNTFQKAGNTPIQKLLTINNTYQQESVQLNDIVTQALQLTAKGTEELASITKADSLEKAYSYSALLAIVRDIDKKAIELDEKVKTINSLVSQLETATEENIRLIPQIPKNAASIEQIRRNQQVLRTNLQNVNANVVAFKGNTQILLLAIQLIENKTKTKELDLLKQACMASVERFGKMEDLKLF